VFTVNPAAFVKAIQAHDARVVAAMHVHGIGNLLTLNVKDFRRFSGIAILSPEEVLSSIGWGLVFANVRPGAFWSGFIQKRGGVRIWVSIDLRRINHLESSQMTPWGGSHKSNQKN